MHICDGGVNVWRCEFLHRHEQLRHMQLDVERVLMSVYSGCGGQAGAGGVADANAVSLTGAQGPVCVDGAGCTMYSHTWDTRPLARISNQRVNSCH
ncbi:unnamed protein product [Sphagnum balticum]